MICMTPEELELALAALTNRVSAVEVSTSTFENLLSGRMTDLEEDADLLVDRIAQVEISTPTLEEQMLSLVIDDWQSAVMVTSPQRMTLLVTPIPVRIISVALAFDYANVAASNTNYWRAVLERSSGNGSFPDIAVKSTQSTGGEANGAIVARRAWTFDSANWNADRDLAKNDILCLNWQEFGTPPGLKLPMTVTVRYAAL